MWEASLAILEVSRRREPQKPLIQQQGKVELVFEIPTAVFALRGRNYLGHIHMHMDKHNNMSLQKDFEGGIVNDLGIKWAFLSMDSELVDFNSLKILNQGQRVLPDHLDVSRSTFCSCLGSFFEAKGDCM